VVENADESDNRSEGANDEATESESGIPDEEKSVASYEGAMMMAAENDDNSILKIIQYLLG
jgi:hypothetical protein